MAFQVGDRVRVRNPESEYTGCRGTIAGDPQDTSSGVPVLGHHVAIDGENGMLRPFLIADLEALRPARVASRSARRPSLDASSESGE